MITNKDLDAALASLDREWDEKILPILLSFKESCERIYAPFEDENFRFTAARNDRPHNKWELSLRNGELPMNHIEKAARYAYPEMPIIKFLGYSTEAYPSGKVSGGDMNFSEMDMKYKFVMSVRKKFDEILHEYGNFLNGGAERIAGYVNSVVEKIEALDRQQTGDFRKAFGIEPSRRTFRVKVEIEEI